MQNTTHPHHPQDCARTLGSFQSPADAGARLTANGAKAVGQDAQTEAEILAAGADTERAMGLRQDALQRFAASSCLTDQADADAQLLKAREAAARMRTLILSRSPEQVARMEQAQAERMAREPGAERGASGG